MATSTYVEVQKLAQRAGLQFVEEPAPAGRIYQVRRVRDVLHQTNDLDDLHGWLSAWLEYVQ